MYSVKAILRGTRLGLRSKTYRRMIARSFLVRLKQALRKGDDEGAYAFAAGIEALHSLKGRA